jgi:hypothetical protein
MKVKVARVDVKLRKFREQPVHLKCSNALEASSIAASAISLATMMRHAADLGRSLKSAIAGFPEPRFVAIIVNFSILRVLTRDSCSESRSTHTKVWVLASLPRDC